MHERAYRLAGHFAISELRVIGVDTRHWWSNGLTIRGKTEPPKRLQFSTVKGEREGYDVVFPGTYTYEAGLSCGKCVHLVTTRRHWQQQEDSAA